MKRFLYCLKESLKGVNHSMDFRWKYKMEDLRKGGEIILGEKGDKKGVWTLGNGEPLLWESIQKRGGGAPGNVLLQ